MTITNTARAVALEIPPGARIPLGNPADWLIAAVAAGWQCQCTTEKGKAKQACGRSHWEDQDHRCRHTAIGACAMRLVLAPDVTGAVRLLCEDCAKGHAATTARTATEAPGPAVGEFEQGCLFELPETDRRAA
jgi:hypothetical protein